MKNQKPVHYGWIVLAMGTLGVFGALGLARFGYTTILPSIQNDLGLDNGQAGLLATLNLSGYLVLSILGGALAVKYGIRRIAALGLLTAGIAMVLSGFARSFNTLALWRVLTGFGSGAANVAIMGLWSGWFAKGRRGLASGIAVSGSSIGLIMTGVFVPEILRHNGMEAWRICWFLYGGITILLAVGTYLLIRDSAYKIGMKLIGEENVPVPEQNDDIYEADWKQVYLSGRIWYLGFIYAAFGFSYIIYMTFFVKYLVSDCGYSAGSAGNLFTLMGWFSLFCGILWGSVSDKIGRKNTLMILFLLHAISFALFALGSTSAYFTFSAVLFGLSAWSVPAIMAAICGDMLGRKMAPAALGFITLFFGFGQALGPSVAGVMADAYGAFHPAFFLASAVALLGFFSSTVLPKREQSPS